MSSIVKGIFGGGDAAGDAADAQLAGTQSGIAEQRRQFDVSQGLAQPAIEAGDVSREALLATLGLGTPEAQLQSFEQFRETPGFQFAQDQGEQAILRNQAAIGGLGGGRVRQELQKQGIGFGSQQFGNFQNRLAALAGSGQTGAQNLAQLGQTTSGNISNLMQAGGQAQASGILGAQQANAGLASQLIGVGGGALAGSGALGAGMAAGFGGSAGAGALLGLLSDIRVKTNIENAGRLPNGINLYTWDWTEEGAEIAGDQPGYGVIAQEVKETIPDAVFELDGYLRVNYDKVIKWSH